MIAGSALTACGGGSEVSQAEVEAAREEKQVRRAEKAFAEFRRLHPAGGCGDEIFVNARANCGFARNMRSVYYAEAFRGTKVFYPFDPKVSRDVKMRCTEQPPHKCTGEGNRVVFFR
ncbi:MAG TPA: hypothetical protein VK480_11030 [Solirubrobacterales bacterium]|nr:hypothetical protein [Solirubrobacterales bacterium]